MYRDFSIHWESDQPEIWIIGLKIEDLGFINYLSQLFCSKEIEQMLYVPPIR